MRFCSACELTEKAFNKCISKKYVFPIYDSYFQTFSTTAFVDVRDYRIYYFKEVDV